ncbi:hypothetical protein EGW08_005462 [Elysia chlorotica]|uniref:Uncharacterized protein n=1 Tax=Elysia chlorotica TaxID=188477 RepID=A0A3S1HVB9_ELYCH|nr:hypothetical protein EGW08_005462 [Elysia chlorotica]
MRAPCRYSAAPHPHRGSGNSAPARPPTTPAPRNGIRTSPITFTSPTFPSTLIRTAVRRTFITLARTCPHPSRSIGTRLRRTSYFSTGANPHWRLDTNTRSGLRLSPSERTRAPTQKRRTTWSLHAPLKTLRMRTPTRTRK